MNACKVETHSANPAGLQMTKWLQDAQALKPLLCYNVVAWLCSPWVVVQLLVFTMRLHSCVWNNDEWGSRWLSTEGLIWAAATHLSGDI